jgi:hypothetical protein
MNHVTTDIELEKLASKLLEPWHPRNHGKNAMVYYGDLPLGTQWAAVAGLADGADAYQRANYDAMKRDLSRDYSDLVREEWFSHWACGGVNHLFARLRDEEGGVTPIVGAVRDMRRALEVYPVLDDTLFHEYEEEDFRATIECLAPEGTAPDHLEAAATLLLEEHGSDPDFLEEQDVYAAVRHVQSRA